MAVAIYSFSALLEIDCNGSIADMTILKNTFPVTPTITPDSLSPTITFAGYNVVTEDCVFNTNFATSLVDDSGAGAGYTKTGMVVPRVLLSGGGDTWVDFHAYIVRPTGSLQPYPFRTYPPYYLNFKQYINV